MRKKLISVFCFTMLFASLLVPIVQAADPDVVKGKTATASDQYDAVWGPEAGIDGDNVGTGWSALNPGTKDPTWWAVDLGESYDLSGHEINWYDTKGAGNDFRYNVEVSADNKNWTVALDRTTENSLKADQIQNETWKANNVRYVRFNFTSVPDTKWASFLELKIFGQKTASAAATSDSATSNPKTGDAGIIPYLILAGVAAFVGTIMMRKKKRI